MIILQICCNIILLFTSPLPVKITKEFNDFIKTPVKRNDKYYI